MNKYTASALKTMLTEEVLRFWERSVDHEHGGFWVDFDEQGNRFGNGDKHLVAMSRMIYTFTIGARLLSSARYGEFARQGIDFLKQYFYDDQHGGFVLTTDRCGKVKDPSKWPYGTAFAIYCLCEYYRSSGDQTTLNLATETFDLFERYAWDHESGGIYEALSPNWQPLSRLKRLGHVLHAMEAVSSLFASTGDSRYINFLSDLTGTIQYKFFDPDHGCLHEHFTEDWKPTHALSRGLILYGHILEAAWFLQALACYQKNPELMVTAREMLGYTLRHGWDPIHGGVFMAGQPSGAVVDGGKMWWVQAAFLGAVSMAYRLTRDVLYLDWLQRQILFIKEKQRDPGVGAWHMLLHPDGTIYHGHKGHGSIGVLPIKAGYHVTQSLFHTAENLEKAEAARSKIEDVSHWVDLAF